MISALALVVLSAGPSKAEELRACIAAAAKGQELRDSGDLLRAREAFRSCAADGCPNEIRADCGRWLRPVEEAVPSVVVVVRDGGADLDDVEVEIDGAPVQRDGRPVELNPGRHRLVAHRGEAAQELNVLVSASERNRLVVMPWTAAAKPAPALPVAEPVSPPIEVASPSTPPPRLGVWIPVGIGAAAVIAGAVCAGRSKQDYDALTSTQGPSLTPSQWQGTQQEGSNFQTASIVAFAVGGAALAAGAAYGLLSSRPTHAQLGLDLAPGHAGLRVLGEWP